MRSIIILLLLISVASASKIEIQHFDQSSSTWKSSAPYLTVGSEVTLRVKPLADSITSIKWKQIIPDVSQYYKNANHPYEPNPYKWVGFGTINYLTQEISSFANKQEVTVNRTILSKNPLKDCPYYYSYLGSFWFQVEVTLKSGKKLYSAGLTANDHRGLSPKVFRISYMMDTTYMGYLTSFLNVPGIFGSVPYQCENYIGVDCADVLMAAKAKQKKTKLKDYNVAMLVNKFTKRAKFTLSFGTPSKKLLWNKDVFAGDMIAVRYSPGKQFAHIGVLFRDDNSNGVLDKEDLVLHAGPHALHGSKLADRGFDGEVVILKHQ